MQRVLIIGCSGSGKTTLFVQLGQRWNLPVVHLDKLWWTGNWENATREEFDARLEEELEKSQWIIGSNDNRTMQQRIAKCDTVIYLDFNRFACLWGMLKRVISSDGKTRPDMGGNCPEGFDWAFIRWIWNYHKTNREADCHRMRETRHAQIMILKNRWEVKQFLEGLG